MPNPKPELREMALVGMLCVGAMAALAYVLGGCGASALDTHRDVAIGMKVGLEAADAAVVELGRERGAACDRLHGGPSPVAKTCKDRVFAELEPAIAAVELAKLAAKEYGWGLLMAEQGQEVDLVTLYQRATVAVAQAVRVLRDLGVQL